jgi:hypothetical protein
LSKLLIESNPIQVIPELAELIGLNEAIFLQQLHYWLQSDYAKFIDDRSWVYNTYKDWKRDNFPFWSEKTLKRIVNSLRELNLIVTTSEYNKYKPDKKLWYTINYKNLEPYEKKASELKIERRKEKEKEKERLHNNIITRKVEETKRALKRSNIEWGQNDPTPKRSNVEWGQNDPTIGTDCPDDRDKMTPPITETTKTEINLTKTNNNNKVKNNQIKQNEENNNVVVEYTFEEIDNLKKQFEYTTKTEGRKTHFKFISNLAETYKLENVISVLNKFDKIRPTGKILNIYGLITDAVKKEFENKGYTENRSVKAIEKQKEQYKPVQSTNFDQREYDDEYFESLYDNFRT